MEMESANIQAGLVIRVAPYIPEGWTARGWLSRLDYMIEICTDERRRAELVRLAEPVRDAVDREESPMV